jgi:hypothetical protein
MLKEPRKEFVMTSVIKMLWRNEEGKDIAEYDARRDSGDRDRHRPSDWWQCEQRVLAGS